MYITHGWEEKNKYMLIIFYEKDRRPGELNGKIKRKAHVK